MKRCWGIEVVFVCRRPLSRCSRGHLCVVKCHKSRREICWGREMRGTRLLIVGVTEKSIWCGSIQHLVVQMMMIRGVNFPKRSFFRHFFNIFFLSFQTSQKTHLHNFFTKYFKSTTVRGVNQFQKIENWSFLLKLSHTTIDDDASQSIFKTTQKKKFLRFFHNYFSFSLFFSILDRT